MSSPPSTPSFTTHARFRVEHRITNIALNGETLEELDHLDSPLHRHPYLHLRQSLPHLYGHRPRGGWLGRCRLGTLRTLPILYPAGIDGIDRRWADPLSYHLFRQTTGRPTDRGTIISATNKTGTPSSASFFMTKILTRLLESDDR